MKNFPAVTPSRFRQPREALKPSGFAIEAAERWALERAAHISVERFRLTSFWYIDYVRQQVPGERKTRYIMRLAQSHNYGVACGLSVPLPGSDFDLVGEDSREVIRARRYRDDIDRAALVDLIIGHVSSAPSYEVTLSETLPEKYALRSRLWQKTLFSERALVSASGATLVYTSSALPPGWWGRLLRAGSKFRRPTWNRMWWAKSSAA
jgi:hypothetical protein